MLIYYGGRNDLANLGTNTCSNLVDWRKTLNYKEYPNKQKTPSRMSRKRARRDVFLFNKYEPKKLRSKLRRERRLIDDV